MSLGRDELASYFLISIEDFVSMRTGKKKVDIMKCKRVISKLTRGKKNSKPIKLANIKTNE